MMLFKKKEKPSPGIVYDYIQSENYRGFKRYRLSSYGNKSAQDGIAALSGKDLTGAEIRIAVKNVDKTECAVVSVGKREVGVIWKDSFDRFQDLKQGSIDKVRVEIRDGDSYLFYHQN